MKFDVEAARKAGYSDDEILAELSKTSKFDVGRAIAAGYSKAELINHLSRAVKGPSPEAQPPQSLVEQARNSQFAQNFVNSAERFAGDIGHAVTHPGETARGMLDLGTGFIEKMSGVQGPQARYADAFLDYYGNRYGSPGQAADTIYTDPVGAMGDVSTLAGLGSLGLRGASVPARMLGATRAANAAEQGARALGVVQQTTDPLRIATGIVTTPLAAAGVPEMLYQSALKPRPSLSQQRGRVEGMVRTGLEERLPISSGGVDKGWNLVDNLQQEVQGYIDDATRRGVTVDPLAIRKRIDDVRSRYQGQFVSANDLAKIDKLEQKFLTEWATPSTSRTTGQMTAAEAHEAKQKAYRKLQGKYGKEAKEANVETLKALARGANEELRALIPEITEPNMRQSKLIDFLPELQRAVSRIKNWDWISLSTPAVGTAAYAMTQSPEMAGMASVLHAVIGRPEVKSRLALGIYYGMKGNPGKYGPANMATATARVDEILNQIRAAASPVPASAQQPQPARP